MKETRKKPAIPGISRIIVGFLEYALMFTVIIECNSLFHYSENYRATTLEVVATVFGIGLAVLLAAVYARKFSAELRADLKRNWPLWVVLLTAVFLFLAVNVLPIGGESALRKYALSFVLFLPAAALLFRLCRIAGRPNALLYKHADLVCVLAAANLLVFAAVTLRPELVQTQLLTTRWSGQGYLTTLQNYLDLCCISGGETRTIAGFTINRNTGFFPEPLMYCIPLITALFTEMFLRPREDRRVWKWIMLLLAIFSSQATLGMMLGAAAVGLKFLESRKLRKRWYLPTIALGAVALAFSALLWQKVSQGGNSIAIHSEHYAAAFRTFLANPLIGCGYLREDEILKRLSEAHLLRTRGLSNSVAVVLAEGGLFLGLLCMIPFLAGLLQIRSVNSKGIAFWTVGPLGLYCLTVFHFHLLLMLFMAFGYSQLELATEGRGLRKLRLTDGGEQAGNVEGTPKPVRAGRILGILLACGLAAALFLSSGFWQSVSRWLAFRQLYLGQSAWKLYFFSLFIILAVLTVRSALFVRDGRPRLIPETVWFLLYSAACAAAYPILYSAAATLLDRTTPFGDLFETGALALLYFGGVGLGWLLIAALRRSRRRFAALLTAAVLLAAGIGAGSLLLICRRDVPAGEIASVVKLAASAGRVYANELPAASKRAIPELTLSPARDGAFAALENAAVLAAHDRDLRDLTDAGFQVTELSPDYVLYTNDSAVMEKLRGEGYSFSRYYAYARPADGEAAAVLRSGNYTLDGQLIKAPELEPAHEWIATIRITSYYGKNTVAEQPVWADDFDPEGRCSVSLSFDAEDWEGMDYSVLPAGDTEIRAVSLTLRETPASITETTYDGRHLPVREAYYTPAGEPILQPQGYAAVAREYDRAGRVTRVTYFDISGRPVRIKAGYAIYTRSYGTGGKLSREAYYDENGEPCTTRQGYAAAERTYDRSGKLLCICYLDASDRPVMTTMGYAAIEYGYNGRRQVTELRHYGENGEKVLLPQNYWAERREYDAFGNIVVQKYCDTEGRPVITAMGYAELHKSFNENRKVILEEYFGTQGEPIALPGGQVSVKIEYGPDGKETARYYYDLSGEELIR